MCVKLPVHAKPKERANPRYGDVYFLLGFGLRSQIAGIVKGALKVATLRAGNRYFDNVGEMQYQRTDGIPKVVK